MQLQIPSNVKYIIETLQKEGYEAYAVGGCVRDSYLGLTPHDWDITTSALPDQVRKLFDRTLDVGIKHGTVVIMLGNEGYEVTTYRIDGEYEDSRHPKEVIFTSNLAEDLMRRDFTINAMAYSEKTGIIDLYNGIGDLEAGIIRAVGVPRERFAEDALRMLRAVRFSAKFGYEIDEDTKNAIKELAPTLANISAERIRDEIEKMILTKNPDRLRLVYELGISKIVLPEWDAMMECEQNSPHHYLSVGEHTIKALEYLVENYSDIDEKDAKILRIATLLHDVAKPVMKTTDEKGVDHFLRHPEKSAIMAGEILRRLRYDNDTINKVKILVEHHDQRPKLTYPRVRKVVSQIGSDAMSNLFILKKADMSAQSDYQADEKKALLEGFEKITNNILENKDPLTIKELDISGKDLIDSGFKEGPELGEVLQMILTEVLNDPSKNTREKLLEIAEKAKNKV